MGTSIMTKKYEEDNPANRSNYYTNTPYIELLIAHALIINLQLFFEDFIFIINPT